MWCEEQKKPYLLYVITTIQNNKWKIVAMITELNAHRVESEWEETILRERETTEAKQKKSERKSENEKHVRTQLKT